MGKAGGTNIVHASIETVADEPVVGVRLDQPAPELTATALRWGRTVELGANDWPTTWPPTFSANNQYEALRRVPDPEDATRWAFHHRISKQDVAWYNHVDPSPGIAPNSPAGTLAPDSFRSEVASTGSARFEPWGTEEWCIAAVRFPSYFRQIDTTARDWIVMFQMHDARGGLTSNPPFACYWNGGGADPSAAYFNCLLRKYAFTQAEYEAQPDREGNVPAATGRVDDPAADTWHYFIAHYRYGNGYVDPTLGAIYGPVGAAGAATVFFKLYHAAGAGAPQLILDHAGYWGSPASPANPARAQQAGFWKTGIYLQSTWNLAGVDVRELWTQGFRQYRAVDSPGMTVDDVLRDFKAR